MTADRVLAALGRDPKLAWEVARRIAVVGPWKAGHPGYLSGVLVRLDPLGTVRAILAPTARGHFLTVTDGARTVTWAGDLPDKEAHLARLAADNVLLAEGVVLLDEEPAA